MSNYLRPSPAKVSTSLDLSPEPHQWLLAESMRLGMPLVGIMRQALADYLAKYGDPVEATSPTTIHSQAK